MEQDLVLLLPRKLKVVTLQQKCMFRANTFLAILYLIGERFVNTSRPLGQCCYSLGNLGNSGHDKFSDVKRGLPERKPPVHHH